ncbi:hypothetical protein PM082_018176 [Marasmius tenuissimus]|nr:hypothetical protein PM082_018176 [Marasmius tenuissimus]
MPINRMRGGSGPLSAYPPAYGEAKLMKELFSNCHMHVWVASLDGGDIEQWLKQMRKPQLESFFKNLEISKMMKSDKSVFFTFERSSLTHCVVNISKVIPPNLDNQFFIVAPELEEDGPQGKKSKLEAKAIRKGDKKKMTRISPGFQSLLSPSQSPLPTGVRVSTPPPTPPPVDLGVCDDNEDEYFAKLILSSQDSSPSVPPQDKPSPSKEPSEESALPPPKKYTSGSV